MSAETTPPSAEIHVRAADLGRLFDPMDPFPISRRDLAPGVEEFVVSWGREIPPKKTPRLVLHLDRTPDDAETGNAVTAIHRYFQGRAEVTQRQLRHLFQVGRMSLLIGIAVLGASIALGEVLAQGAEGSSFRRAIGGTLEIGGWVAMWRPFQIFLYEWWPIRADIRLYRRLADMPVRVVAPVSPPTA